MPTFVNLFTKRSELGEMSKDKSHIVLPNIKVACFGGFVLPQIISNKIPVYVDKYREKFFYRATLNLFIKQALRAVDGSNRNRNEQSNASWIDG